MSQKRRKKGRHEHHAKPVTRRQFIAQGLMEASGFLMMPTVLDMVLRSGSAYADCPAPVAGALPFMVIDCAGGAGLMHSFVPTNTSGDMLPSYSRMGLGTGSPNVDMSLGAPLNAQSDQGNDNSTQAVNKIRDGFLNTTSAATRANLRITTICNQSNDDTDVNNLSPLQLIALAGLSGQYITTPVGSRNNAAGTGANSIGPSGLAGAPSALPVRSVNDVTNAVSIGGALANLSDTSKSNIAKAARNLSTLQTQKLSSMTFSQQFKELSDCGYAKNVEFTGDITGNVDPTQNAAASAIYANANQGEATIVYNVLQGNTGPGAIQIGGCDYHNDGRAATNSKDLEIGQTFGRMIELAAQLNKPLMVAIISDGAVDSDQGSPEFASDDGTKGMAVLALFDPTGAPSQIKTQLGGFTDGQSVDRSTPVGSLPAAVPYFITANWLNVQGRVADFGNSNIVRPSAEFDPAGVSNAQLTSMLAFAKKA